MLVGLISDTHDRLPCIHRAVEVFNKAGVCRIIHAGDFVAPFAIKPLLELGVPVSAVFGNNDGERAGLQKLCPSLSDPPLRIELGGRTIIVTHSLEQMPQSGREADIVVYGHTHREETHKTGDGVLLVNPGEACGWLTGCGTMALLELPEMSLERVVLVQDRGR